MPSEDAQQPQTPRAKGAAQCHSSFLKKGGRRCRITYMWRKSTTTRSNSRWWLCTDIAATSSISFALVKNLPKLCEQYDSIFVATMGYSASRWYGRHSTFPATYHGIAQARSLP